MYCCFVLSILLMRSEAEQLVYLPCSRPSYVCRKKENTYVCGEKDDFVEK
jgi:hypothetical protein